MADSPIGYTSNLQLKKFAERSNPGANALNGNLDLIDAGVASKQDTISVSTPLLKSGSNISLNVDSTNFNVSGSELNANPINIVAGDGLKNGGTVNLGGSVNLDIDYNTTNLKSTAGQINVIQDISPTSSPTFANVTVDNLYINNEINQVNQTILNLADKKIVMNNGGDNITSSGSGLIVEGTANVTASSFIFDSGIWNLSHDFNLASGKNYRSNNIIVIDSNRNISGSNALLTGELTYNGTTKSSNNFIHITPTGQAQVGKFRSIQLSTNYNTGTVPDNGILFNVDTNLYRDNTNVLKTDGNFIVGGTYLKSYGDIYSDNFNMNYPYKGYYIGKSGSIFEKINANELHVKSFVNDEVLSLNSELDISKSSTKLTANCTITNNTGSLKVEHLNFAGKIFENDDYVLLQDISRDSSSLNVSMAIGKVNYSTSSSADQTYTYYKLIGSLTTASSGSIALNLGKNGDGFIRMRAISELSNKAYMNFSTFNSASVSLDTHTQIGDLSGVNSNSYGALKNAGAWSNNIYLEGNASIAGTLTAGDSNGIGNTFYAGKIKKNLLTTDSGYPVIGSLSQVTSSVVTTDTPFSQNENVRQVVFSGTTGYIRATLPQNIGVPVKNKWYTVSCWIRNADLSQVWFGYEPELGSSDTYARPDERTGAYSNGSKVQIFGKWVRVSCSFRWTAITPTTPMNLYFYISYGSGTAHITGVQIEESENVTSYQKVDGTISSDSGYGMWSTKGGFGGTIQNPIINLSDSGLYVNSDYSLAKTNVGSNGVYIGNYQSKAGFNGIILNQSGQTFYNNNYPIFNFNSANASASIAGFNFNRNLLSNPNYNIYIGNIDIIDSLETSYMAFGKYHNECNMLYMHNQINNNSIEIVNYDLTGEVYQKFYSSNLTLKFGDITNGIFGIDCIGGGKSYFTLTNTVKRIAGWSFDDTKLWSGASGSNGAFTTSGITLSSAGFISSKNFYIDTAGNVNTRNAVISGSTFTGGTLQTAATGKRVKITTSDDGWGDNSIYFYDSNNSITCAQQATGTNSFAIISPNDKSFSIMKGGYTAISLDNNYTYIYNPKRGENDSQFAPRLGAFHGVYASGSYPNTTYCRDGDYFIQNPGKVLFRSGSSWVGVN